MSTRTRIILRGPGMEVTGAYAVKNLIALAAPYGLTQFKFPPDWNHMSKREKLTLLSRQLPVGYRLELFQEPRGTRIKQSLYHSSLVAGKNRKRRHPPQRNKGNWVFDAGAVAQGIQGQIKRVQGWGNAQVQAIPVNPVMPPPNRPDYVAYDFEAIDEAEIPEEGF